MNYIKNMFDKKIINQNKISISIFIFLIAFGIFHYIKPGFAYDNDGAFRQFGLGYKNKTIIPIWLVAIIFAIFSYLIVLYYLANF
jgi:hypothetical protein